MKLNQLLLLSFLFIFHLSMAQNASIDSTVSELKEAINKLKTDPAMKSASWGICVMTADSGKIIAEYNADTFLIPASTIKAVNTAAALAILGKDFRFRTKLEYDGVIVNDSILNGNIYITGGGDPTLGSPRLDSLNDVNFTCSRWLNEIKKLGIKKINGAVIGDASIFDDSLVQSSWVYEDLGRYYGAGTSGLNFHENYFQVFFKAGAKYGDSVKIVDTIPIIKDVKIVNSVKTGYTTSPYKVFAYGNPYQNQRIVKGTTPRNKDIQFERISIPDPAYYCASSFSKMLTDSGIVVRDTAITVRHLLLAKKKIETNRITFFIQESPAFDSIVKMTNLGSVNTYAESIVKMIGVKVYNSGSFYAGTKAVKEFWKNKGVDLTGFEMKDGSGLSVKDKITPRQLASIMRAYQTDSMYSCFINTLPVAGKTGSISNIFKNTAAENNLTAKSGYMRKLRSYTGYVSNKSGKSLTFAIIVNKHTASAAAMKTKLEKIMVLIAETN